MKSDTGTLYPSIEYGYGIWKIKTIPLLTYRVKGLKFMFKVIQKLYES